VTPAEGVDGGSRITPSVDTKVGAACLELTDDTMVETIEAAADIQVDNDGTGTVVGWKW
jgi:uncharacterized protein YuzE